ncbi:hypothetical protein ANO11243_075890 [Dothideomycetidae sp. 11243]|nr:hypothetical protein ANO11243_075890 [fungal sp. No.11243]
MTDQASHLAQLPRELLDRIASHLPTTAFNALRLTCKTVENNLFKYWSNAFFAKRQFMIDKFSLRTLVDISEHAILSRTLKHLVIGLDDLARISTRLTPSADELFQARSAIGAQQALLDTGEVGDVLARALEKLPNLETIDLRDFDSRTRFRDRVEGEPVPYWRSYGASQYGQWSRDAPPSQYDHVRFSRANDFISRVCRAVITTLAKAPSGVRRLEFILRRPSYGLQDEAFIMSPALPAGTLSTLTALHLDLALPDEGTDYAWSHPLPESAVWDVSTLHLRRLLHCTPSVTWLRLNFKTWSDNNRVGAFITWLGRQPQNDATRSASLIDPDPITLDLRRLDLGGLICPSRHLVALLDKFSKLKYLSLRNIRMGGFPGDGDDVWADFLRQLPARSPQLNRLELRDLLLHCARSIEEPVMFEKQGVSPLQLLTSIVMEDVDGQKTEELAALIRQPDYRTHTSEDEMDEDDEDDVDNDVDVDEDDDHASEDDDGDDEDS